MNTIKQIAQKLKQAGSVLLFPHVHMDGDALGSAAALTGVLRKQGKTCYILIEDEIAGNLRFLDRDYCTDNQDIIENPDLCVYIDCGDESRIPKRHGKFISGRETMCIDHHRTNSSDTDYAYVDPDAAATGEIIYDLIIAMGAEIDAQTGEALYAAIATDTGNFQYSNCTKKTHEIAAALYDSGMNHSEVCIQIYENVSIGKIRLDNMIMNTLDIFADGRAAMAFVTQQMLEQTGTGMDETEGIVSALRSIKGVEISVFLKEYGPEEIKVSMRAKSYADVAEIAVEFAGGGHTKAAGFTGRGSLEDIKAVARARIEEQLNRY